MRRHLGRLVVPMAIGLTALFIFVAIRVAAPETDIDWPRRGRQEPEAPPPPTAVVRRIEANDDTMTVTVEWANGKWSAYEVDGTGLVPGDNVVVSMRKVEAG